MSRTPSMHSGNEKPFSRTSFGKKPLSTNLAELQRHGHQTLEEYIDYILTHPDPLASFTIPVVDEYLYPLTLAIKSVDGEGLSGFWQSPFCNERCTRKTTSHPCIDGTDSIIDCDMFCAGFSPENSDYGNDRMLDLTQQSLCQTNHRGELTSCGIRTITLHHQHRSDRYILVSIELSIGCSDEQQSVLVMQHHAGLTITLK